MTDRRQELERVVARAIRTAHLGEPNDHQPNWVHDNDFMEEARAAIDAIYKHCKEPTPEMLESATSTASHQLVAKAFWQAMFPLALGRDE